MNKLFIILFFLNSINAFSLTLNLTGIKIIKGQIVIAVYNHAENFPNNHGEIFYSKFVKLIPDEPLPNITLDIPYGRYAVAVFHDVNNNKILDKNFLGIPKESFGFSNNPKITIKAPDYKDCEIEYSQSANNISIKLIKML